MVAILTLTDRAAHEPLLERFHGGLYRSAFAAQAEPLEVWRWALWSDEAPYRMTVQLAVEGDDILGGICFELYRRSRCGLVTYVVVAPEARRGGLGKTLRSGAARTLYGDGAHAVFGEVNDPRVPHAYETAEESWRRLERYQRWGSRVLDIRYIQPSLGPGLERDRGLVLVRHAGDAPPLEHMSGQVVKDFIAEFYEVTEDGRPPDDELSAILAGIPDPVRLVQLSPAA
ncbi:MAG TPA: GNAT family N-acetyltransferase [Kofleriaceae bacterium]|nr:GNAT family N-acetyltransferase [Kofleriaceae bacterium]